MEQSGFYLAIGDDFLNIPAYIPVVTGTHYLSKQSFCHQTGAIARKLFCILRWHSYTSDARVNFWGPLEYA